MVKDLDDKLRFESDVAPKKKRKEDEFPMPKELEEKMIEEFE